MRPESAKPGLAVARNLLRKTADSEYREVSKTARHCVLEMKDYLVGVRQRHLKKDYLQNPGHLIGNVYREDAIADKHSEINAYCLCQICLAVHWYEKLVEELVQEKKPLHRKQFLRVADQIHNFLHDVRPYIEYLERKTDSEFEFFRGGKSYAQESWQVYRECFALLWASAHRPPRLSHRTGISYSIFALRQSLEVKFRRILGVHGIHDRNYDSLRIRHEFFPAFIDQNLSHFRIRYDSLTNLTKIYRWTNHFIHTGDIPLVWEAWYAIRYSRDLFRPTEPDENSSWSTYDGVRVVNYEELKEKLVDAVASEYGEGPWCFVFGRPEAVIDS